MRFRLAGILVSCAACAGSQVGQDAGPDGPVVTAVGSPTGTARTARIGADGGTLATMDGLLELVVPPGALSAETELSLTPISSEAPLGVGPAVRLSPDGTTFAVPAKLVLHYEAFARSTAPELLLGATQDAMGRWQPAGAPRLDPAAKTVTIEVPHFSDWSFATCAGLTVDNYLVSQGVDSHFRLDEQCSDPAMQTGLLGPVRPTSRMVEWKKEDPMGMPGPGQLDPKGAEATVSSTDSAPPQPRLIVTATWHGPSGMRKFRDDIAVGTMTDFVIDGHTVLITNSNAVTMGGKSTVNATSTTGSVAIAFAGAGEGGFSSNPANQLPASATFENVSYQDSYTDPCTGQQKSLFTRVSVSHANRERQFIVGSFQGQLAVSRGMITCGGTTLSNVEVLPLSGTFVTRWLVY